MNDNSTTPQPQPGNNGGKRGSARHSNLTGVVNLYILIAAAVAVIAAVIIFLVMHSKSAKLDAQLEQVQLEKEQLALSNEYQQLNNEFAQYENQTILLANDSIVEKYAAAKAKVEKLLQELNAEKTKNRARIAQLEGEIKTLKSILKTYVERIDELSKENANLRNENEQVKNQNRRLSANLTDAKRTNEQLSERMTLAEKLNVTGIQLQALKSNGKVEKNITKAKQLKVTFTIPQNNSTPVGEKTIYLRITNPEGDLLRGNGQRFSFENQSLDCSAAKTIEYEGEEIGGITIYWDVNTTLNPGEYTVELFADNFRLASRKFTMTK